MNLKGFLDTALSHALDVGMGSSDDVLRHVTPELLATHLPRPLWARLLTACMGAPRVDAQLVVETVGVANLCEHMPIAVMWNCLSEIALRSLGREFVPLPVDSMSAMISVGSGPVLSRPAPLSLTPPPEERPREPAPERKPAVGPAIPSPSASDSLADVVAALEADAGGASPSGRARSATQQRFRQTNTGIGRLAANNARRPQAVAPVEPPMATAPARTARRGSTEVTDYDLETDVAKADDWKNALAVEDEQLVDWSGTNEETQAGGADDFPRKR